MSNQSGKAQCTDLTNKYLLRCVSAHNIGVRSVSLQSTVSPNFKIPDTWPDSDNAEFYLSLTVSEIELDLIHIHRSRTFCKTFITKAFVFNYRFKTKAFVPNELAIVRFGLTSLSAPDT